MTSHGLIEWSWAIIAASVALMFFAIAAAVVVSLILFLIRGERVRP